MNRSTTVPPLVAALMTVTWVSGSFGQESRQAAGETHYFEPTHYYNTFSFAHAPALRIKPGDRVVTRTVDNRGVDETNTKVTRSGTERFLAAKFFVTFFVTHPERSSNSALSQRAPGIVGIESSVSRSIHQPFGICSS